MDMKEALTRLTAAPGVTGNERAGAADIAEEYFRRYTDDVWRSTMGNVYARVGSGKPVVMFAAHMDEVGMVVDGIEDNGMLRIRSVAGVDPRVLPGSEVLVYGHGGEKLPGVIGAVPPHLLGNTDKDAAYKITDLACDIGYPAQRVRELVDVGDSVTFAPFSPAELKNGRVAGKTFDDRALVTAMIEALDILSRRKFEGTAVFCATVQEERGGFGAKTGAFELNPDLAIAIDVCHAPTPGTDPLDTTEIEKVAITRGSNLHEKMVERIISVCDEENIPYDIDVAMGPTGTDAWDIQIERGGIATGLFSLPLRYMHTSVECIDMKTLKNCAKVMAGFVCSVGDKWEEELCSID